MGIEKESKYPVYIAIPHTRHAERWYLTPETQPDKEDGDVYILGDHDLHAILCVESREELEALREYNGHQWAAVRAIVEDIRGADMIGNKEEIMAAIDATGLPYVIHGGNYVIVDISEDEDQLMVGLFPVEITADCGIGLQRKVLVSLIGEFEDEQDLAEAKAFCGEYAGQ